MITLFITYHLLFRYQFSNLTLIIQNEMSAHITRDTVHGTWYVWYTVQGARYTVHGTRDTGHTIQNKKTKENALIFMSLHCTVHCAEHCTVQCTVHWDSIFRYSPVFLHLRDKTVVEYFNKYTFTCINMLLP